MTAPAHAAVPRDWLGMAADGPMTDPAADVAGEWDRMARTGVRTVRLAFYWQQGQPTTPAAVSFGEYDRLVATAAQRGLKVLPVVLGSPQWVALDPRAGGASPPSDPVAYGRFLQALVGRYGPRGSLWAEQPSLPRRPIRDWQIWNEPDYPGFWSLQPFAARYVGLLREARRALRAADPGARAILGGLTGESWDDLRRIYRAGGRGTFDAVALHPYTAAPRNVVRIVRYARRVMRNHGDRAKPIWLTEMSFPAAQGRIEVGPGIDTDDARQARKLRERARASRGRAQGAPDPAGLLVHVALGREHARQRLQLLRAPAAAGGPDRQRARARDVPPHGPASCAASPAAARRSRARCGPR